MGATAAAGVGMFAAGTGAIIGVGGGLNLSGAAASVVALIALLVLQAGWLLVWPSRLNVAAWQSLALATAAYVVPLIFLNELGQWPAPTVHEYLGVLTLGAVCFVVGLFAGNAITGTSRRLQLRLRAIVNGLALTEANQRIWIAGSVVALFLGCCYAAMGYIPLVSGDPTLAKYLQGPFSVSRKVAFAYHVAVPMASVTLMVTASAAWDSRQPRLLIVSTILLLLLLGTDQRTYAGTPILVVLLVAAGARRVRFVPVLLAVLLIGPVASAANYELSHFFGAEQFARANQGASLLTAVANGATDVPDSLQAFGNFLVAPQPMHGRSFYANLSYTGNQYSPSQWGIRLANPGVTDLSTIVSGGVRYPTPIWGYFAWEWWGAALVSFVTGILGGLLVGLAKAGLTERRMTYIALLAAPLVSLMAFLRGYEYFNLWACLPVLAILFVPLRQNGVGRSSARTAY